MIKTVHVTGAYGVVITNLVSLTFLVPRTRFELVISTLRGWRVRPLHQRGMAADPGFEPGLSDSESDVLPLD